MDTQRATHSPEYVAELEKHVAALSARHQLDGVVMALVELHSRYVLTQLLQEMQVPSALCAYCGAKYAVSDQAGRDEHQLTCSASPAAARIRELEVKLLRRMPIVVPMQDRTPQVLHDLLLARAIDLEMLMTSLKTHPLVESTTINLSASPHVDAPWEFTLQALPIATEMDGDGRAVAPAPSTLLTHALYRGAGDTVAEACVHALTAWMENHAWEIGDDA